MSGRLTDGDKTEASPPNRGGPRKAYLARLESGRHYVIDLRGEFDTLLRVEDGRQRCLRFNDDIDPGRPRHSRLVYTPAETGTYTVVAAAGKPGLTGAFTLTIGEVKQLGEPAVRTVDVELDIKALDQPYPFFKEFSYHFAADRLYSVEVDGECLPRFLDYHTPDGEKIVPPPVIDPRELGVTNVDLTPERAGKYLFRVSGFQIRSLRVSGGDPAPVTRFRIRISTYAPEAERPEE